MFPMGVGASLTLLILGGPLSAVLRVLILTVLVAGLIGTATWYIVILVAPMIHELPRLL